MMISAFAHASRLSVDAVRFYVRRGLLHPELGKKGGSRPYQIFSAVDVEKARIIRLGKSLGLSLKEIGAFLDKRTLSEGEDGIVLAFLADQRRQLSKRVVDLKALISFIDAKTAWIKDPSIGPPPPFPK